MGWLKNFFFKEEEEIVSQTTTVQEQIENDKLLGDGFRSHVQSLSEQAKIRQANLEAKLARELEIYIRKEIIKQAESGGQPRLLLDMRLFESNEILIKILRESLIKKFESQGFVVAFGSTLLDIRW